MPGLNYRKWTAALIPLTGLVLGAIGPANMLQRKGNTAQKETQRMPGRARVIFGVSGADTAICK